MTTATPDCMSCKRFHVTDLMGNTCEAFPAGVPEAILLGRSHKVPFPGDGGLLYDPVAGVPDPGDGDEPDDDAPNANDDEGD